MAQTLSAMSGPDIVDFAMSAAVFGLTSLTAALGFAGARGPASRCLPMFFVCLALDAFVGSIVIGGRGWVSLAAMRWLHVLNVPAAYLLGPLLYSYALVLTSAQPDMSRARLVRHLLPAGIVLAFSLLNALLALDRTPVGHVLFEITFNAWVLQGLPYFVLVAWRSRRARPLLEQLSADEGAMHLAWLRRLVLCMEVCWVLSAIERLPGVDDLFGWHWIDSGLGVVIAIELYFLAWFGLRQRILVPADLGEVTAPAPITASAAPVTPTYARSGLDDAQCANVAADLTRLMSEERLYADGNLDLQALSRRSGWPPNYISQALNQGLGCNFFEFVNGFRVEAARRCLVDAGDERTILDIALACGFGSKSTFNTVFKRMTGTTPGEMRRAAQPNTA